MSKIEIMNQPLIKKTTQELFSFESSFQCYAFPEKNEHVPPIDEHYCFHEATTLAILAGFRENRRVLVQGLHGTGKSSHIQQIAAHLSWPCMRINLDGNINRLDLVGKDVIALKEGKQITEFNYGIIPWAMQRPMALIIDEYDAGKPEIMFVIQHLLENEGGFTLLDKNEVVKPHPQFRLFATANTLGLGDTYNMYHGTNLLNHAQLDRWNIVCQLNYLPEEIEKQIIINKVSSFSDKKNHQLLSQMVRLANMTRRGMAAHDLTSLMSPRTVLNWAENHQIFDDIVTSFELSYFNRTAEEERPIIAEYFQRVFDIDLTLSTLPTDKE